MGRGLSCRARSPSEKNEPNPGHPRSKTEPIPPVSPSKTKPTSPSLPSKTKPTTRCHRDSKTDPTTKQVVRVRFQDEANFRLIVHHRPPTTESRRVARPDPTRIGSDRGRPSGIRSWVPWWRNTL